MTYRDQFQHVHSIFLKTILEPAPLPTLLIEAYAAYSRSTDPYRDDKSLRKPYGHPPSIGAKYPVRRKHHSFVRSYFFFLISIISFTKKGTKLRYSANCFSYRF